VKSLILLVSFGIFLSGCTSKPVYNVKNENVPNTRSAQLSLSDIEKAILSASQKRGWSVRVIKPGLIEASISSRKHRAAVEIPYSQSDYSIIYKSSENLEYENGKIHRNYNNWIIRLSRAIQNELGVVSRKN